MKYKGLDAIKVSFHHRFYIKLYKIKWLVKHIKKQHSKQGYGCKKCGWCCNNRQCKYLNKETWLCTVYDNRPCLVPLYPLSTFELWLCCNNKCKYFKKNG